jgi:hypothetical protein
MRRLRVLIVSGLIVAAFPAAPAAAKEQTHARLTNAAQLRGAAPGARVRVAWTLDGPARLPIPGHARIHGMAVYALVTAASGGTVTKVAARPATPGTPGLPAGAYVADVTVPAGGIHAIAIDVEAVGSTAIAPSAIPIDNPFTADAPGAAPGSGPPWAVLAAGLAAFAALLAAYAARTARRPLA